MCTALSFKTNDFYFGRTLDWLCGFGEKITVTGRNYPLIFRQTEMQRTHYAMIGTAVIADGYPLYFDAVNEKGLCMAGLNFPGSAEYKRSVSDRINLAAFELIPYILGKCESIKQAEAELENINIIAADFSPSFKSSPLHWIISDRDGSLTVESTKSGLRVYTNSVGVLTNNPPFETQMFCLNNYMNITSKEPVNRFSDKVNLSPYCVGMGALGLPGDPSSPSRFVRAAFAKFNSSCSSTEEESVSQFFHIMNGVSQIRGCSQTNEGESEYTVYTSCCNADKGIYYYTSYRNSRISAVDMNKENLDGNSLISFPMLKNQDIKTQN